MTSTEWKTYIDPNKISTNSECNRVPVRDHPLKNMTVTDRIPRRILGSQPSTGRTTPVSTPSSILEPLTLALQVLDPLTEFSVREEMDPLSKMAAEMDGTDSKTVFRNGQRASTIKQDGWVGMEPWSSRKNAILSKYTTSEKISIVTSFLSEGEKVIVKAQSTAIDKVQHRLEQLDCIDEGSQKKLDLSQSEYIRQIKQLNQELVAAWESEQRVKSLKIAIQCAKLLADTNVLSFYPSKFVLISDILDIFGQLVYDRLRTKANYYKPGSKTPTALPEDFTPDMVPEMAKETCLNWFYKIASIRELVPRVYVEIALLKSYNFISSTSLPDALTRLTKMIVGIGNPLVAVYLRCYLCRIGIAVCPPKANNNYLKENFAHFLDSYPHLFSRNVKLLLEEQKLPMSAYMTLYTPALDYILEGVACTVPEATLNELLQRCEKHGNSSLILNTIMSSFKPAFIAERTLQFLRMMNECSDDGIPLYLLLRTLGLCVSICPPPSEQRRQVLSIVWKMFPIFTNPGEYVMCVEAWIQFVIQYFSHREINMVLGDITEHMTPNRVYENYYNELKLIVQKLVTFSQDLETLLLMDNILPFIDMFQQDSMRIEVSKKILSLNMNDQKTNDPIVTNSLIFLCRILHDSIDALTPEDEYRQIGEILCGIVRRVDYGRDFEQQMNFYVEARPAFTNIDVVLAQLIQCVNTLSVSTRQIIKGFHTKKTADFVRACAAYCFITIPSIKSVRTRLELYLLSGQVASSNQCLGQADACFKAALNLIPQLQQSEQKNELFLYSYIKKFLSTLLVVPDNPDRGVLSLTRSLLNVIRSYDWNKQNCYLGAIYIHVIDLLGIMSQEIYPYHIDKVEANDALYGSDPKFIQEINNMCSIIIGEILTLLKELGPSQRQSQLAFDLFIRVVIRSDLNTNGLLTLAVNLWNLSLKNGYGDIKYMSRTRDYLKTRSYSTDNVQLQKLIEKLNF